MDLPVYKHLFLNKTILISKRFSLILLCTLRYVNRIRHSDQALPFHIDVNRKQRFVVTENWQKALTFEKK